MKKSTYYKASATNKAGSKVKSEKVDIVPLKVKGFKYEEVIVSGNSVVAYSKSNSTAFGLVMKHLESLKESK